MVPRRSMGSIERCETAQKRTVRVGGAVELDEGRDLCGYQPLRAACPQSPISAASRPIRLVLERDDFFRPLLDARRGNVVETAPPASKRSGLRPLISAQAVTVKPARTAACVPTALKLPWCKLNSFSFNAIEFCLIDDCSSSLSAASMAENYGECCLVRLLVSDPESDPETAWLTGRRSPPRGRDHR